MRRLSPWLVVTCFGIGGLIGVGCAVAIPHEPASLAETVFLSVVLVGGFRIR